MSRKSWTAVGGLILAFITYGTVTWFQEQKAALPEGIVSGNGRIEAEQIRIAAKTSGRVLEVLAAEGDMIAAGAVLARLDTTELQAMKDRAEAEIALARESKAEAEARVVQRESELLLAEHELDRARNLLAKGHISQADFETRETTLKVATAVLRAARAQVATARTQIDATIAESRRIQTQIDDSDLVAPAAGRILYRLAEPGEIVAAGEPILSLLSLENVYMEIFLPTDDAGLLALGAEARIVLDALPDYAIPANVTFVSPEAQFTPRQVETLEEREKLVFRVRVKIPPDLVRERIEHVKTGVRGVAFVRLAPSITWPERLEQRIPADLFEQ